MTHETLSNDIQTENTHSNLAEKLKEKWEEWTRQNKHNADLNVTTEITPYLKTSNLEKINYALSLYGLHIMQTKGMSGNTEYLLKHAH